MLKTLFPLALLAAPAAHAQTVPAEPRAPGEVPKTRTDAAPIKAVKLILVGDSTMAPGSGWASMFCAAHVKSSVACLNLGRGGRSTRSYRQEGSWEIARNEIGVKGYDAVYVLIQFGHNDQSSASERWTAIESEFPANLTRYVQEVRAAGGIPVLLTPLSRREFKQGKLNNTLDVWSAEVRKVAAATQTPLVDLNADSAALVQKLGPVAATKLAQAEPNAEELAAAQAGTTRKPRPADAARLPDAPTTPEGPRGQITRKFDYTHVGDAGARVFGRVVANGLARAVPALRGQLVP
ncbi:rhamnogalacturonan acetylesterase [Sphingomonas sp. HF-S4]|uniref:Rhamnogalacturonan acetylesterase n=1 Tax=Sphingomonas agrestis TaxID=3080540 RepID=A0ABU3Y3T6_9SPHN|nr:rhamnogalacturonan acetylesterase [Sphingomonas sp. HF-S4]MDV3455888.1 rhamnogalacturonan acetylesterase [Sphingomonas sp. HF-S4]